MIELLIVFFLCSSLAYYVKFRRSRKRMYELAAKIPGPFDLPLIGSSYMGYGLNSTQITEYLLQFMHSIPTPMRGWLGPFLVVIFDKPEHLSVILNSQSCVQKSPLYKFFRFEKGIIFTERNLWRLLRKRLNPTFSSQTVRSFVPVFDTEADRMVDQLDQFVGKEAFDILPKTSVYTISATLTNLMKVHMHTDDIEYKEEFADNAEKMWILLFRRIYKPWLFPEFIYRLTPEFKRESKRIAQLQDLSREVYEARLATKPNFSESGSPSEEVLIERLEQMFFKTGEIDHATMMNNIDTFLFASNDTTTNVIANSLLMMAMHPAVQERAYQEVLEIVPSGAITAEDLSKLVYLEMVIKETMRLIPVAPIITRTCEEELQVDQWTIPAGAIVAMPIMKIHRDRSIWGERSEDFDPDNFLPEKCAQRNPYAYLPFSSGLRNCIGMRYAWVALKVALAKLIRRYRFSTDLKMEDIKFEASLVLLLSNKHMMRIEWR
ncbi:probable cytochrome P450 313a4 [Ochlerotatus camptorhynchus]|uniref:probable cytochrome P450 313a4 n=1 Tax=Ochlerotatus camptorhynchus TaxID=644619 RepID=UPI0031DF560F